MKPAMAKESTAAGPAWLIVVDEPTNSPAPMMQPMAIMDTWRDFRLRLSSAPPLMSVATLVAMSVIYSPPNNANVLVHFAKDRLQNPTLRR